MTTREMEVMQINLNHCNNAHDLLHQNIREYCCDVAIISDPYMERVPTNDGRWVTDKAGLAAINVCGKFPVQETLSKDKDGFVIVKINGVYVCGCYAPPRLSITEYEGMLDDIVRVLYNKRPIVIAGDFNAWSTLWGSKETNPRGHSILQAFAQLDVVIANVGKADTFRSSDDKRKSVIDITFCSPSLLCNNWRVLEDYTASDHMYIRYTIGMDKPKQPQRVRNSNIQWKHQELDMKLLCDTFQFLLGGRSVISPEELTRIVINACDVSMPRKILPRHLRTPVYWWNDEIALIRAKCNKARRHAQRARNDTVRQERMVAYKRLRLQLTIAIKKSKRLKFKELCESVDDNPWGNGYRIVMSKLKGPSIPRETCPKKLKEVVEVLFPQHEREQWSDGEKLPSVTTEREVTNSELIEAANRLRPNKAPGPDGVPNVALKTLVKKYPDVFRRVYQSCMERSHFPTCWKRQKLVLIPKPGKSLNDPSSYRPIGLLDGLGKLLERIIQNRLLSYTEGESGLSENQFGFRRKRSTVDAIRRVTEIANKALKCTDRTGVGRYCAIATIDVKNAFNSASWKEIVGALDGFAVSSQLTGMIKSYLSDRTLLYDTAEGLVEKELTAGVPQGSILGPILWNIMYNGILNLSLPGGAKIIGFADDIIVVKICDSAEEAESIVESSVEVIQRWLSDRKLQVAHQKTEVVVVSNSRKNVIVKPIVGDITITSKRELKYLGVMLDDRLNFTSHVDYICEKASKVQQTLARLMPNKFGARNGKRRLLANVTTSILRYGGETWSKALESESNRTKLNSVHRLAVMRVVSAYRTVSYDAACVIAGMKPIALTIQEDARCGESKRRIGISERPEHEEITLVEWQQMWDRSSNGRWTHRLIPQIKPWLERGHGEVGYHLTQFLTGHGAFEAYLYKRKKVDSPYCPTCVNDEETAEHALFICPRFDDERAELISKAPAVNADNIVRTMCESKEFWTIAVTAITRITDKLDVDRIARLATT